MLIVLPNFTIELEEKLDEIIKDIAIKNHIDLRMVEDSKTIETGKNLISQSLIRIYENYDVENRKRMEEFEKEQKERKNGK